MPEGVNALRLSGAAGLAGSLLLFAGDMLFYGRWGSGAEALATAFDVAVRRDDIWIIASGLLAPLAGFLYLGSLVYLNAALAPASPAWRRLTIGGIGLIFVTAVATHAVWAASALSADPVVMDLLAVLFLSGQVIAIPVAAILLVLTITGRTIWPRWFAVLNPGLIYLLLATAAWLPAPLGYPVVGGAFNLAFAVFFAAGLATSGKKLSA